MKLRPSFYLSVGLALLAATFLFLFIARGHDAQLAEERVQELTTELWSTELAKDRVISQCQEVVLFAQGYAEQDRTPGDHARFEYQINDAARPCLAY